MRTFGRSKGGGRRSEQREQAPLTAVFTSACKSDSAELMDFSATGARLRGDFLPDKGEEVLLSVETLKVFGVVAWAKRNECGIAFDHVLTPDDVNRVRSQLPRRRRLFGMTSI